MQLVWRQQDGDPVAVILLSDKPSGSNKNVELEAIELGEGQLLIAGCKRHLHDFAQAKWKKTPLKVAQKAGPLEAASEAKTTLQR